MVWTPRTGVQVADGTWWFLDRVKDRLAHFDGNGRYLGQVSIAEQVKSPGCLMEWPVALADGSLVMTCEGDLVALVLPSCPEYVLAYLGAARLGAVTTGVKDKAGTALQDARTFRFQTAP